MEKDPFKQIAQGLEALVRLTKQLENSQKIYSAKLAAAFDAQKISPSLDAAKAVAAYEEAKPTDTFDAQKISPSLEAAKAVAAYEAAKAAAAFDAQKISPSLDAAKAVAAYSSRSEDSAFISTVKAMELLGQVVGFAKGEAAQKKAIKEISEGLLGYARLQEKAHKSSTETKNSRGSKKR